MRRLSLAILLAMFLGACADPGGFRYDQGKPTSLPAQPTLTPVSVALLPESTPSPTVADSFTCSEPSDLTLGVSVWRSPSLNLDGLNDVYLVPIDLDKLVEEDLAGADGYPSVLTMKGLEPSDYEACRKTFSNDLKERIVDWSASEDRILLYESNGRCNGDTCPPFRSDLYLLDGNDTPTKVASLLNGYNRDLGVLDLSAAFSPDGKRLAYIDGDDADGGKRIVVMDLSSNDSWSLATSTNDSAVVKSMQWSPDGTSILFSRECPWQSGEVPETCSGIWSLDAAAGGQAPPLSTQFSPQQPYAIGDGREPVWSPDGQSVAFTNFEGVWIAEASGDERKLAAPWCAGWACGRARWSPDGSYLALKYDSDNRQTAGAYGDEVWVISLRDSSKRRVSPQLIGVSGPAEWSPDGQWIAYGGCSRWGCSPYISRTDGSATILIPLIGSIEAKSVLKWKP